MASSDFPVAIIGLSCRLPESENAQEFWEFLLRKGDSVGPFPSNRAKDLQHVTSTFDESYFQDPDSKFFTGSFFNSIDKFDESFFGIFPGEAQFIDPQQRFFLRAVYEAIEDAGLASKFHGSNTGIYVGNTMDRYRLLLTENNSSISHGNHPPFIASRVSYIFNLKGPAMMVGTGCSSSLLAVHLACQGLASKDCDLAIAGGITLDLLPINASTDIWNQLGITGKGMRCRAFDGTSAGIAKGEGCGVVILKRLDAAIADGNHIYGVIAGSVANQDGHSNGITAPNPASQSALLVEAWNRAKIHPRDIGYFEAHGTGTQLGDPIEMMGIQMAFDGFSRYSDDRDTKPGIGSLKANVGHLADGAAGILSLVKSCLCLHYGKIPGQANFDSPNKNINWDKAPFEVKTETEDWPSTDSGIRVIGVSSFGLVGTNVHVVLQEYKPPDIAIASVGNGFAHDDSTPILISAKTRHSLLGLMKKLDKYLEDSSGIDLNDLAYTLHMGREHNKFGVQTLILAHQTDDLKSQIRVIVDFLESGKPIPEISTFPLNKFVELIVMDGMPQCFTVTKKRGKSTEKFRPPSNIHQLLKYIYNGEPISWEDFYRTSGRRRHLPLLPTYFFDERRFWPRQGHPIFLSMSGDRKAMKLQNYTDPSEFGKGTSELNSEEIRNTLSDILTCATDGTIQDWESVKDVSLFELGLDSLITVQIRSSLIEALGESGCLSFGEMQAGHTFEGLVKLLSNKILENGSGKQLLQSLAETIPDNNCSNYSDVLGFDTYPVSSSQRRLWMMQGLSGNKSTHNVSNGVLIQGNLDVAALKSGFEETVGRHDSFYTNFILHDSKILQRIERNKDIQLMLSDLMDSESLEIAEQRAVELFTVDYGQPFDLEKDALIRATLYKLSPESFFLAVIVHHIIFDGRSHFIFYNELWRAYRDYTGGKTKPNVLAQSPTTFARFACEEQVLLKSNKAKEELLYWQQKLGDFEFSSPCIIPGDKPRPPIFSSKGRRITTMLEPDVVDGLRSFKRQHFTMFQKLLGGVYSLINIYSGQTDLIVGSPMAGRIGGKKYQDTIGFFVNMLPLRIQLDPAGSFQNLLTTISYAVQEGLANSSTSFDSILTKLGVTRDPSVTPVFSISVCYHNTEHGQEHVGPPEELKTRRILPHNESAKWDLYFDFLEEVDGEDAGKMRFTLEYYSDFYSQDLAAQIANEFTAILRRISILRDGSDILLQDLAPESGSIARGPSMDLTGLSLVDQILKQCIKNKSKTAISTHGSKNTVSYEDLTIKSIHLGQFLRNKCSLESGDRIGLLLTSNTEHCVISILACLLFDFVFVPLDTDSPVGIKVQRGLKTKIRVKRDHL